MIKFYELFLGYFSVKLGLVLSILAYFHISIKVIMFSLLYHFIIKVPVFNMFAKTLRGAG